MKEHPLACGTGQQVAARSCALAKGSYSAARRRSSARNSDPTRRASAARCHHRAESVPHLRPTRLEVAPFGFAPLIHGAGSDNRPFQDQEAHPPATFATTNLASRRDASRCRSRRRIEPTPHSSLPTYWRWRNSAFTKVDDASVGNARLIPNRLLLTAQTLNYDVIT
jgi:hypothetical protein